MSNPVKLTLGQKRLLQELIDHPDFHLELFVRGKREGRWELYDPNGPCGINRHTCNALLDAGVLVEVSPEHLGTSTAWTGYPQKIVVHGASDKKFYKPKETAERSLEEEYMYLLEKVQSALLIRAQKAMARLNPEETGALERIFDRLHDSFLEIKREEISRIPADESVSILPAIMAIGLLGGYVIKDQTEGDEAWRRELVYILSGLLTLSGIPDNLP